MFDKAKFAQILKNISDTYITQRDFSKKSGINRTYLSQYMNMKLDKPPKPSILQKLANASHNIIDYNDLMSICGYTETSVIEEYLENIYSQESNKIENALFNIHLSKEEEEAYELISNMINSVDFFDISQDELTQEISSYFESMDWLTQKSKEKIMSKLKLFIQYMKLPYIYAKRKSSIRNSKEEDLQRNENLQFYMCPVYGSISAGIPNWAEECIEGRIPIDPVLFNIINPEEHFFLRVNGESMNKIVRNGAYALIHKQDMVENGEIAVVLVNGDEATLKKFSKQGDLVVLEPMSNDSSFQVQVYDKNTPIKVLGKYVGKFEINK